MGRYCYCSPWLRPRLLLLLANIVIATTISTVGATIAIGAATATTIDVVAIAAVTVTITATTATAT